MENQHNHWTFDKRISLSHMITTISLVGAILVWGFGLETKVDLNTREILHQKELRKEQTTAIKDTIRGIRLEYQEINRKLDKLIDRELEDSHVHAP